MKQQIYKWLKIACIMHFVITLPMNMIFWITEGTPTIMRFNHNLVILLLAFIISGMVCIFTYTPKPKKSKKIKNSSIVVNNGIILFTTISFIVRIFAEIAKDKKSLINDSYMLLVILLFSFAISISITLVSIRGYWQKTIYYFLLLGIAYCSIFIIKPKFTGSKLALALLIYIGVYLMITLTYYFTVVRRKKIEKNKNKKYTSIFK